MIRFLHRLTQMCDDRQNISFGAFRALVYYNSWVHFVVTALKMGIRDCALSELEGTA